MAEFRGTTICAVRRNGEIAIAGDGQVTMGENVIMKNGAKKVRRIFDGKVVIGFAGSVADAFALSEKFEGKLTQYAGNLPRAAVELAQDWRMNKEFWPLAAAETSRWPRRARCMTIPGFPRATSPIRR